MQFNPFGSTPKGFQAITDLSAAVGLTVPAGASFAIFNVTGQNVRWRDDGTNPSATVGMLIAAGGQDYEYQGNLSAIKFIEVTSGAKLNISYYSATGGLLKP